MHELLRDFRLVAADLIRTPGLEAVRNAEARMRIALSAPRFDALRVAALGLLGFVAAVIGISGGIGRAALHHWLDMAPRLLRAAGLRTVTAPHRE
jgi:hypothetical protein